ncbi:MAG TPA: transcription termination factor NusA, partial [Thermoanaerobaculia bacterium]|nr:transcription termination factor NusA [Thermoanaerobaculia bacterium]
MPQAQPTEKVNLNLLLQQVAREKDVDIDRWIGALEDAMASAAKKQHRIKEPVRSELDRDTGEFRAFIVKQVVEEVEDPLAEWTVEEAREHKDDAAVGDEIHIPVSTEGLGRIAAQSAKQVLYQRIREAERENVYDEFVDRTGEVVNGTVKRFERGDIIIDLGRTEAIVPRSEQARHERYSQGERIRGVIIEVHKQPKGPQIVMSRTDPRLLVKLFEMEVPEIYDGTVIIKNAVRAPGERAKVAVVSRERDVDPVGACVGMKGSRVQSIIRELRGEKIDIVEHSDDLVTFAQAALAPARITRVSVTHHGERPHLDVIVEDEQLSLAIGRRGQNVRLASELIGARIDIKSESDVKDEVADAHARMLPTAMAETAAPGAAAAAAEAVEIDLTEAPGIGAKTAAALEAAGYGTLDALVAASAEELAQVEGLGPKTAAKLADWAREKAEAVGAKLGVAPEEAAPEAEEADVAETAEEVSNLDDTGFMAALSRAF